MVVSERMCQPAIQTTSHPFRHQMVSIKTHGLDRQLTRDMDSCFKTWLDMKAAEKNGWENCSILYWKINASVSLKFWSLGNKKNQHSPPPQKLFTYSPCRYVLVLRYATESLRMESLSNLERMFCSKGRMEARWSSSPLSRSLCHAARSQLWFQRLKFTICYLYAVCL